MQTAADDFRMAPGLDADRLRPVFERLGRIHLPGALRPAAADRLADTLESATPWSRAVGGEGKAWDVPITAIEGAAAPLAEAAYSQARTGFQFLFDVFRLSDAAEAGADVPAELQAVYSALNGPAFLDFVRRLTGDARVAFCDAQATRYLPGHFLTEHDDEAGDKRRLYAYVLNLSRVWRVDWGGLLLFHAPDGHVAEGYTPAMNTLNIFRVPQKHSVSLVTPFAGAPRLSVTGWLRARTG